MKTIANEHIEPTGRFLEAQVIFDTLQHEVLGNAAFNWIEEFNRNRQSGFTDLANLLSKLISPALKPELYQHHDDAACLLFDMTDDNTHPEQIPLDDQPWESLKQCINNLLVQE